MNTELFDHIVAGFYRAAVGAIPWGEALLPLQQAMEAWVVQLYAVDLSQGSVVFSYEVGEASAEAALDYLRTYHRIDPRAAFLLSLRPGAWVNCWEHFDDAYVASSPFYQEFLLPYGGRYASGAKLLEDGPVNAVLGIHRGLGREPLDASEIDICRRLARHLSEALKIFRAHMAGISASILGTEIINRLRAPVALIDDQRKLLHANPAAEALLGNSSLLVVSGGHLYCRKPREDNALLVALRDLQLTGDSQLHRNAVDKVYFRVGFDQGNELGMFVYALRPAQTMHAFGERSLAMVLLYQAESRIELDPFIVAGVFDLTPAEARVAVAIAEGETIETIAERHSVSMNTVRTQLRNVFEKTRTTRQVELVGLLASMPTVALTP